MMYIFGELVRGIKSIVMPTWLRVLLTILAVCVVIGVPIAMAFYLGGKDQEQRVTPLDN